MAAAAGARVVAVVEGDEDGGDDVADGGWEEWRWCRSSQRPRRSLRLSSDELVGGVELAWLRNGSSSSSV